MKIGYLIATIVLFGLTGCNATLTDKVYDESVETGAHSSEAINAAFSQLDTLIEDIKDLEDKDETEELLNGFLEASSLEMIAVYYCSDKGDFWIAPYTELPEDYDFQQRPPYLQAVEEEIYIAEPYEDFTSQTKVQTLCKVVKREDEFMGVIGMDYAVEDDFNE